ncbi:amino acid permease [Mangrovihabitans endophyticus]|uniref:Amino acid permease n=1 Tax=Mangrovihabitans endophyticus TaxID=1751298 RepID=A0A8J3FQ43_9ACTN|nr:amino acid permease [Mangrovihabitans endophyticus]
MAPTDHATRSLAGGRLAVAAVVFFAITAAAPMTVVCTIVPALYARDDLPPPALAFVAVAAPLLLFSLGYGAMMRRAPNAGALYAVVARGLGRPLGAGAAWLALLSYQCVQLGLYAVTGAAAAPLLSAWLHLTVPWWQVAAVCWLVVAICGPLRVAAVAAVVALIAIAEMAVITGFALADVLEPADGRIAVGAAWPTATSLDRAGLGLLLVIAILSFTGFETTAAYSEEAMRPRRSIGRAAPVTVLLLMLIFVVGSWTTAVAAGAGQVGDLAAAYRSDLLFQLAGARLAPWAVTLGRVLLLTGLVAALIALHQTIARYLYAAGRERLLPVVMARTARRTGAPRVASITQSLFAAAVLGAYVSVGAMPDARLAVVGGLGILVLLCLAALATLLFLNRSPDDETIWRRFVAPALATISLGVFGWLAYRNLPILLGTDLPRWTLPAAMGATLTLGVVQGLLLRLVRRITYAGIGVGGAAVVTRTTAPEQRAPGAHRPERVDRG